MSSKEAKHGGSSYAKTQGKVKFKSKYDLLRAKVLGKNSSFAVTEAYKAARTNLMFTRSGDGCQKIAMTSALESEGKSLNCVNLAITLAQNGLRVLIIDADMRQPKLNYVLQLGPGDGLSEVLAGIAEQNDYISPIQKTQYDNLDAMAAGKIPPNPAELLNSKQMRELLDALSQSYDYILVDTPPIGVVTDALVIAKMIDGYILVVRSNSTPKEALNMAVMQLENIEANIMGFLLNDVTEKSSYGKYGKYGRYGYSSGYERGQG